MKIALYGGAFDPVHNGHIAVVDFIHNLNYFDEIWILPSEHHKYDKTMSSFDDRVNMCKLSFEEYENVYVKSIEQFIYQTKLSDGSTYDLIRYLKEIYSENEFYFIIGEDNAQSINQWKESEKLREMLRFITLPRGSSDRNLVGAWYKEKPNIFLYDFEKHDISSSQIRSSIELNLPWSSSVNPKVFNYIQKEGMYVDGW